MYLGIDFGTSTNYIVKVNLEDEKVVQVDNIGEFGESALLDNAIYYGKNEILIGKSAIKRSESDPRNLFRYIKSELGTDKEKINIPRQNRNVLPREIASDIFKSIKSKIENLYNKELIEGVVITVPFDYRHKERKDIREAAKMAGLNVLGLIEEPLAASISTNIRKVGDGIELVFDLGGGTLDITIANVRREKEKLIIETLNTEGSKNIGGRYIDEAILNYIGNHKNIEGIGTIERKRLLERIRKEKENLIDDDEGEIFYKLKNGERIEEEFSEEILERILDDNGVLDEIKELLVEAIEDANIEKEDVVRVIFVGGATKLNIIKKIVENFFGDSIEYINYREQRLVGEGAGYYLMDLLQEKNRYKIIPKLNHSIGIDRSGKLEKIVEKNFEYNKESKIKEFIYEKNRKENELKVYQGESRIVNDCVEIGKIRINTDELYGKIGISFEIDKNGIIKYNIYDMNNGKSFFEQKELN